MRRGLTHRIGTTLVALAAGFLLSACETRISANATTNSSVDYSHVYVTVSEVWLNASATAGPDDTAWIKATLDEPQTFDLVNLTGGVLKEFASQLPVAPGTYNQIRLILADTRGTLTDSADSAGADFNNQVNYFDLDGNVQIAPLEVPNVAGGIAIQFQLDVQESQEALLAALGSAGTSSNTGTNNTGTNNTGTDSSTGTDTTTDNSNNTNTTSTDTSGLGTVTANAVIVFDANRDISRFTYSDTVGFTLNARLTGQDLANVGTIRSQIDVTAISNDTNVNRPDVQVTAQKPSEDGSRNVPVLSAPVRADGTFILYPFPTDDDAPSTYDLVFHGPQVQTVIIKSVPVQSGTPSSAATIDLNNIAMVLAPSAYLVNVAEANPLAARGARIGFYQTINASDELPYLIEERTVDPTTGLFALDQILPTGPIAVGTFSSGTGLALNTVTPVEGAGAYKVAASGALLGDGSFGDTLAAPANGTTTTTLFNAPALPIPTDVLSGTITATVTVATPGRYDRGTLVITHDGAIVGTGSLDSVLSQASGTVTVSALPAGDGTTRFEGGTYFAEAWAWNSSDPVDSFVRQPAGTLVDLRASATGTATLTVN